MGLTFFNTKETEGEKGKDSERLRMKTGKFRDHHSKVGGQVIS